MNYCMQGHTNTDVSLSAESVERVRTHTHTAAIFPHPLLSPTHLHTLTLLHIKIPFEEAVSQCSSGWQISI